MLPPNVDRQQFCRVCAKFATGVTVATVIDGDGEPHGITVNSFTSVSLVPPLVLFCVDHRTRLLGFFRAAKHFGINILAEQQQAISQRFARSDRDRLQGVEWHAGRTGVPLLAGVLASLECELTKHIPAGDHDILIGEVIELHAREGKPLIFFGSEYKKLE